MKSTSFKTSIFLFLTIFSSCKSSSNLVIPKDAATQTTPLAQTRDLCSHVGQSIATAAICYAFAGYLYVYIVKRIQAAHKNVEELEQLKKLSEKAQSLENAGCTVTFPIPTVTITRLDDIKNDLLDTFVFPAHVAWANFWTQQAKNDRILFFF